MSATAEHSKVCYNLAGYCYTEVVEISEPLSKFLVSANQENSFQRFLWIPLWGYSTVLDLVVSSGDTLGVRCFGTRVVLDIH